MKQVAGRLRLDLAQYRELVAFTQFGSELDKATQAQLARGARMTELLKQPQYRPLPVEKQIVLVYAGAKGFVDKYPIEALRRYENELFAYLDASKPEVLEAIRKGGAFGKPDAPTDVEKQLVAALGAFADKFGPSVEGAKA